MTNSMDFRMEIEDVFFIRKRGTIVTGVVSQGEVHVGQVVILNGYDFEKNVKVVGIEKFRRPAKSASAGEMIGIILEGVAKDEVSRGDLLESSGSLVDDYTWEH